MPRHDIGLDDGRGGGSAWSANQLELARETTSALFEELGLAACLFAIEPREGGWELKVEWAVEEGWEAITLPVAIQLLLSSGADPDVCKRVLETWASRLAACRRNSGRRVCRRGSWRVRCRRSHTSLDFEFFRHRKLVTLHGVAIRALSNHSRPTQEALALRR
jgi:hypothetical protein